MQRFELHTDFMIQYDVWQDWMLETLADMKKLRREATSEKDFNRLSFTKEMIDRIRNVKSEIVNAQGIVSRTKKFSWKDFSWEVSNSVG